QRFLDSADLFLQSGNHVDDREALVRAAARASPTQGTTALLLSCLNDLGSAAHLYQRESMKVEASRCFVQAGNFKKAVNFLRSVDEFEAAANVSKQYIQLQSKCKQEGLNPTVVMTAPIQTPDNLLLEAIAHYHRHGEEDKKISCLNRLPVDTRLTFFAQHVGDFEAAAKAADQDQNPQFVAECLLIQSRKQRKDATYDIQGTKDNLISCMVLYQKSGNNEARAEAMMMLGDLTDDHTMLNSAIKHFGNNTAGALEAATLLVKRKKTLTFGDIRLILTHLEDVFSLVRALLVASRRHNVKEQQGVKACELFYGVKRTDVSSATFSSSEEPRILDALDFSGRSKSTGKRILTENFTTARDTFHKFQGDAIVMTCIRDHAKSLWESASHSDRRSNTDLLIKISSLFRLAKDPPVNFSSLLLSAEEGFKKRAMDKPHPEKIPKHVGMICLKGGSHSPWLFRSFLRRLEEFFQDIYERENVLSSLDSMRGFMGLLAKRAMEPLIPSFANTCFFMELLVVICYSMYAKMNHHMLLCLPASYISMVHMCDRLWSRGKGSIYSAIQQLPYKKDEILGKVNDCIWFIIDTICQSEKFPDFNVIDDAFRPNTLTMQKAGEMERVFILALVLICGCGGPVPKNAEVPLRKALYKIGIKKHFPKRLADAIRGMRSAKGIRDVVLLLQKLLKPATRNTFVTAVGSTQIE
ncbi:TPR and ankyrin repeat-containing protein 1, partial [Branchiostoma belcheri]